VRRVAELFQLPEPPLVLRPRYNIAPTQPVAVVGLRPDGATRGLTMVRWGLVPAWANGPRDVKPQVNARSETVAAKPFFRESFKSRRCLVVADGYYEWFARDKPYLVRREDDGPFALAGLLDVWGEGAERLATCCLITTAAADWLQAVHDRMPLILPPECHGAWLDNSTPTADLLGMLRPYPGDDLMAVRVGTTVNNVLNEGRSASPRPPDPVQDPANCPADFVREVTPRARSGFVHVRPT
jgi:putative SOS response-associated peptidase YedK